MKYGKGLIKANWLKFFVAVNLLFLIECYKKYERNPYEMSTVLSLNDIIKAQYAFKTKDIDANNINDYWTGDLSGLYRINDKDGQAIQLITAALARADLKPLPENMVNFLTKHVAIEPACFLGYYYCAMILNDSLTPFSCFNKTEFGFLAIPELYGVTGKRSFICSQDGNIYSKEIPLKRISNIKDVPEGLRKWPEPDPISAGWQLEKEYLSK